MKTQQEMFELPDELEFSIELIRRNQPSDNPYYGCFSGGKDSVALKEVVRLSGVAVEWHYHVTTIDPPELVRFIHDMHPDVHMDIPKRNFFKMAQVKGFPTRRQRWCCEQYKERRTPKGRTLLMGIRAAESPRRAMRWAEVTYHTTAKAHVISPILHWSDEQTWAFIRERGLPYCSLYDEGFKRLGCVGCPMAGKAGRMRQFERWPHYYRAWRELFRFTWNKRHGGIQKDGRVWFGDRYFTTWEEMFDWWLSDQSLKNRDECMGLIDKMCPHDDA
ncbi:MAG: phosphoadenosine phosphosulfate reductase family protein [Candidatus Peregrinibacteria bacterium]